MAYALGISPAHMAPWSPGLVTVEALHMPGWLSLAINILTLAFIAFGICIINKVFNVTRDPSILFAAIFMVLSMSAPQVSAHFSSGTLLAIVQLACMYALFATFQDIKASHHIYFIFLLLGAGAFVSYVYLAFIPVYLTGCIQMRSLNLRTSVAAALGLATTTWILFGSGLIGPSQLAVPHIVTVFTPWKAPQPIGITLSTCLSIAVCITCGIGCAIRSYGYNSRARSFNGFIYLLTLTAIVLPLIDWGHAPCYLPLLNLCAAYQAGHLFAARNNITLLPGLFIIISASIALYIFSIIS